MLAVAGGAQRMQAQGDADLRIRHVGADQRHRLAVREQHVMADLQRGLEIGQARRVPALVVADDGRAPGLVVRDPVLDAVAQAARDGVGQLQKGIDRGALVPAAALLQELRQVPVVERGPGLQAAFQHAVDQALVEVQAFRIRPAARLAEDARPGNREAVGIQAEIARDVQVFRPAVVVVAGHRPVRAVADLARRGGEAVPDRFDPAILLRRALDLVGRGGAAPQEFGAEVGAARRSRVVVRCRHVSQFGKVSMSISKKTAGAVRIRVRPPCIMRPCACPPAPWPARRARSG